MPCHESKSALMCKIEKRSTVRARSEERKSPKTKTRRIICSKNISNNHGPDLAIETVVVPEQEVKGRPRSRSRTPRRELFEDSVRQTATEDSVEDIVNRVELEDRHFNDKIQVSVSAG